MTIFSDKHLQELLGEQESPCLSLYMPTHRTHPDNAADPILYRNLVKDLKSSFHQQYGKEEGDPIFNQFDALAEDKDFWNYALDGLAIFATPKLFKVFRLQRPVTELTIVADSLHTKPLQKYVQSADRFQVLALNLDEVQLYEGNRYQLDKIELEVEVPETMEEALGDELTDNHLNTAFSTGNGSNKVANEGTGNVVHGYIDKGEEHNKDAERFFRAVDRAILEQYSKPSGLPIILAALPEHHNLFHQISHNKQLVKGGLKVNAAPLSSEELKNTAWTAFEPTYLKRLDELVERYRVASSRGLGSEKIEQIAKDTIEGKVDTLLVEEERIIPGKISHEDGSVFYEDLNNPQVDDLLDDLAELVRNFGGQSVVIPADKMPTKTGIVSINRY